jgi:site-specific recombinase XerD
MTTLPTKTLQALVQDFFQKYLLTERNASPHTIAAYRDTLKLFLQHAAAVAKRPADKLDHEILDVNRVRSFLDSLRQDRRCGPRTRNQRLAALKSFARYVASVAPEHLDRCQRIREIPSASFEHCEINYLDDDEVTRLLGALDARTDRRDRALLLVLYNTGARVQEIADLNVGDFHAAPIPLVHLRGKGRKQRTCPLWSRTVVAVQAWLAERQAPRLDEPLFLNARGQRLSRSGIAHLLRTAAHHAELTPRHARHVSPHVLRHTTAMHLLRAGVDITTIAAWLGHAQLSTTHGYVEIDLRMKRAAITGAAAPRGLKRSKFPKPDLITWLVAIGRKNYAQSPEAKTAPGQRRSRSLPITRRSP